MYTYMHKRVYRCPCDCVCLGVYVCDVVNERLPRPLFIRCRDACSCQTSISAVLLAEIEREAQSYGYAVLLVRVSSAPCPLKRNLFVKVHPAPSYRISEHRTRITTPSHRASLSIPSSIPFIPQHVISY